MTWEIFLIPFVLVIALFILWLIPGIVVGAVGSIIFRGAWVGYANRIPFWVTVIYALVFWVVPFLLMRRGRPVKAHR